MCPWASASETRTYGTTFRQASGVSCALGQAKRLLHQLSGLRQLSPDFIYHPQPCQHLMQLRGLPQLLAEHTGAGVCVLHLRRRLTLGNLKRLTESDLHRGLLPDALGGVGEVLEQLRPCGQEGDRLRMGRTVDRLSPPRW
jgi:hypothetical protein